MDSQSYADILELLDMAGRQDLIVELQSLKCKIVDECYNPKEDIKKSKLKKNKEPYSDDEGSAEEENIKVKIDQEGFYSIDSDD